MGVIKVVTIVILTIKMLRFATLSICLIILALAYDSDARKEKGRGGKRLPKEFYKIDNINATCDGSETASTEKEPSELCSTEGELCICGKFKKRRGDDEWKAKCAECKF